MRGAGRVGSGCVKGGGRDRNKGGGGDADIWVVGICEPRFQRQRGIAMDDVIDCLA